VKGQLAALGLVPRNAASVRVVVGINGRLIAAHRGAAGAEERESKQPFARGHATPFLRGFGSVRFEEREIADRSNQTPPLGMRTAIAAEHLSEAALGDPS